MAYVPYQVRHGQAPEGLPFLCGNCGERFATKGAKRRHKANCAPDAGEAVALNDDGRGDDEHAYGHRHHITPEIKARANAEWAAMDWRGRLPEGWTWGGQVQ